MKLNLLVVATLLALATQAAPQTAPTSVTDFAGLQSEIKVNNSSSSGDANLRLDADVTATANLTPVEKSLTLTGKEATKTLDGAKAHKGFVVKGTGTKLTLKDLLLQNFHASAVTVESGSVADITNVTFSGNSADRDGGAIYNYNGTATITNTKFENNKATGNGGAIYNFAPSGNGSATITNSFFISNNASGNGGAIYNYVGTTTDITNTIFTSNSAGGDGGAIFNEQWAKIANATFSNNSASNGGAIYNKYNSVEITNSSFSNNSASNGGAIYNYGGARTDIADTIFTNNSASGNGGAIYNQGTATITNCSFSGNNAANGGAIYNEEGGTIDIFANAANVEFTGNTAAGVSNAIYNEGIVNFNTYGSSKVIVNDAISGGGNGNSQLHIQNNVSLNGNVSGNNLTVHSRGTLDFGDTGKFNDVARDVSFENGATLNLANGTTSEAIVANDVSVESGSTANVVVDVDLANKAVDSIKAGSSTGGGTFKFENFRILSDAATADAQTVIVFTGTTKPTMAIDANKKMFTSNYAYSVATETDNGALTFTRGKDEVDGVLATLHAASGTTKASAVMSVAGISPMAPPVGSEVSLSLTEDYSATADLAQTPLSNGGELTIFGQGKTLYGNTQGGFNVSESTLNIENATLRNFNSALTIGENSNAEVRGVNFLENTGAIVNKGTLTFTDCSFTNNGTTATLAVSEKDRAGAIYNVGRVNVVAAVQDIVFSGNSAGCISNSIQCAVDSNLYLDALGHRQILFNDSIAGEGKMYINEDDGTGTIVLNADMSGYTGTVEMDGGTLQLGANGTFFNRASEIGLYGGTLDFANGHIQDHTFNTLTISDNADMKMHVDADLAAAKMDTLNGKIVANPNGIIDVTQIRLLSDAATEKTEILFANDVLKGAVKYSGTAELTYSPLFKYSAAYNDQNGKFTFTRSNSRSYESFNPAVLASPIASQVGGYLTQLATYQQAFMGMERHMLLTSNLRANMSNSAPDTTKAQFDQNDLWIRPYTTYETVELDHGPNVDNVAWGTIVGFDSRLHDLGHEFDGGLSFYAGYNGSQQTYQSKDIVQHGGVLGMTGVLYRGNFFSGLTISGGASQAKADTDYGTDDFTILTAGIAAQTGYNWEVVKDRFIIQPGFSASYTFVKAYDYTSNSGVAIDSDPFHTVTLEPGLKFIGNLDHGWQPYCGVSMVWNLMGETETEANTIALPEMSIKPYVKGNVGVQKLFTDSLSGYLQLYGMGGGRDAIGVQLGFSGAF